MRAYPSVSRRDDAGYSLIEVVAAMAILSVLVLGLTNLWSTLGQISFGELLRQKTVFALNGEMERLDALYTTTGFGAGIRVATTGYPAITNIAGSTNRLVYDTESTGVSFVVTSLAALQATNAAVWKTGFGLATRNYVWIDQDRGILGMLSWMEQPLTCNNKPDGAPHPCQCYQFSGGPGPGTCITVMLVLNYPYTISGGAPAQMPGNTLKTLSLMTIMGRRA
jgi:prepilin-type N-terminal cleavage/methylation domain-containing protein